jgi:hypothetical protein
LLCQEFWFTSLGRQVAAFIGQHSSTDIDSLKAAIAAGRPGPPDLRSDGGARRCWRNRPEM